MKRLTLIILPVMTGIVITPLVHVYTRATVGNKPFVDSLVYVMERESKNFIGFLFFTAFSLIPFVLIAGLAYFLSRTMPFLHAFVICASGMAGALAFVIPTEYSVWYPVYGPGRASSTSAIAFVFIPIYSIIPSMIFFWGSHLLLKYMRSRKSHW